MPADATDGPIGVFDSGFGGLTVLSKLIEDMPYEDMIFVGDSARCPYGPRDLQEVRRFCLQICDWLVKQGCKLVVIACNTATAAGLRAAQLCFPVPVIGVVEPGARAAVHTTRTRNVGVIATRGTVASGSYEHAIHNIDAGIEVISLSTPPFVELVEAGIRAVRTEPKELSTPDDLFMTDENRGMVADVLSPLRELPIDTLVLGCTHYPIIEDLIAEAMGESVELVSSAEEVARDAQAILKRRRQLSEGERVPKRVFYTTGNDVEDFRTFGGIVMGVPLEEVRHLDLPEID